MKYIKTWMGVTTGSHLGRDDGYPERKFRLINTIDELVQSFDPKAEYYKLEEVDVKPAVKAIKDLS